MTYNTCTHAHMQIARYIAQPIYVSNDAETGSFCKQNMEPVTGDACDPISMQRTWMRLNLKEAQAKIVGKAVQGQSLELRFSKQDPRDAGQEQKLGTEIKRLEQRIRKQ